MIDAHGAERPHEYTTEETPGNYWQCCICQRWHHDAPAICYECIGASRVAYSTRPYESYRTHPNARHVLVRGWAHGERSDVAAFATRRQAEAFAKQSYRERGHYLAPDRFFVVFSGAPVPRITAK